MLYDPKWEQKTKADPFNIETLIAWLEKQNPNERYDYCATYDCLLGQYLRAHGFKEPMIAGWGEFSHDDGANQGQFPRVFWDDIATRGTWTFGAALKRARAVAAKR